MAQMLYAQNTVTIGETMYQNLAFTIKDKQIFDLDREGSRVWDWNKAKNYCNRLNLDAYNDWRVASQKELEGLMRKKPSTEGLFIKSAFASAMPATGGKYDDVWMWTRDSKEGDLGAFVNFKKAKTGWADKKYKGYVICTRTIKNVSSKQKKVTCKKNRKQELTRSADWIKAWNTCSGYTALKKDGSLWQFGKVGECGWGQIIPFDPQTGKAIYKEKTIYTLKPKKIGTGFTGAKIINGGYRMYAIKRDGTLWGWGEGLNVKPKKLSSSRNWLSFGIKYEGNGCCGYDVGLKKDGSLWRIPESAFARGKYKTALRLQKIGQFSDWKKIVLGCCAIYGLRKNGTLWKFDDAEGKNGFKKFIPQKRSYDGDQELYPLLKSKMSKVRSGAIYNSQSPQKTIKANRDGTLCLLPIIK
jgi:hypothetical protein